MEMQYSHQTSKHVRRFNNKEILTRTLTMLVIVSWLYSGWPQVQIGNIEFPPEPEIAQAANTLVSVETVTGTTGTGATATDTFSNGTALNKMFHFCSFSYDVADSRHFQSFRATELTATDTLTIYAGGASGNDSLTYRCYIVIFSAGSDLVVNRYTQTTQGTPPFDDTITDVGDTSHAFIIPHGEDDPSDTTVGQEELWTFRLENTTTVRIDIDDPADEVNLMYYEVVDWNNSDINVQHLAVQTMTTGETTDTVVITTVDTAKSWLITTGRTEAGGFSEQTGRMNIRTDFENSSIVRVRRGVSGIAFNWVVQVIEDVSAGGIFDVDMNNIAMTTGQTSNTLTIGSVDTTRTFVAGTAFPHFAYSGQTGDTSTSNNDMPLVTLLIPVTAMSLLPSVTATCFVCWCVAATPPPPPTLPTSTAEALTPEVSVITT